MNVFKGIFLKLVTTLIFTVMGALVRLASQTYPLGEIVFYRGACAIIPVAVVYAWRRELLTAVRMNSPLDHLLRGVTSASGMFFGFASLSLLPLVDSYAIGFTAPLITVALAVVILGERVRAYRWSAVGIGFAGVLVMLIPHIDAGSRSAAASAAAPLGIACALIAAVANAANTIQTRRMTGRETTSAIVFYFSVLMAIAGLCTLPIGWKAPDPAGYAVLVSIGILGGLGHILLIESFRFAPASVLAPFDYTVMIWALVLGYLVFGELPGLLVFLGAAIVSGAGLFVILRECQLGLQRVRAAEQSPPVT